MFQIFELPHFADTGFVIEAAWTSEMSKESPDWPRVEEVLRNAWHLATEEWHHRAMAVSAARGISIVLDEHCGDRTGAESIIALAKERFSGCHELDDQLANIFYHHGEYEAALTLSQTALSMEGDARDCRARDPFAFRRAGISAMKVGQAELATKMFVRGAYWAEAMELLHTQTGLHFDAAYCAFKAGLFELMLSQIIKGLSGIGGHPDPEKDFLGFALQKLAGFVVLWILNTVNNQGSDQIDEPVAGCCSNPDFHKGIKDLPRSPYEITLTHAIELEDTLRLNPVCEELYSPTLLASRFPVVKMKLSTLRVNRAFRKLEFANLPDLLWKWQQTFWEAKAQQVSGQGPLEEFRGTVNPSELSARLALEYLLLCSLSLRSLKGQSLDACLEEWNRSVASSAGADYLTPIVERVAEWANVSVATARMLMRNESEEGFRRLGAAISLLAIQGLSPDETAYAQIATMVWLKDTDARFALEESLSGFSKLYSAPWEKYAQTPAILINPRITVPQLQRLAQDQDDGARKLNELLQTASVACNVRVPSEIANWLKQVAQKNVRHR